MARFLALVTCACVAVACASDGEGAPSDGALTEAGDDVTAEAGSSTTTGSDSSSGAPDETSATTMASSSTTTTSGESTDEGGTGLSPTATCEDYLACAAATIPAGLGRLLETYGPNGTCWQSTPEVAEQCDMACGVGLMQLMESFEDEIACGGDGIPKGCGDGEVQPGEQCDGTDLMGFDCQSLGLGNGTLLCDPVRCVFDTSMC